MRTLSEIYQANRAQSLALEKALAEAQQQASQSETRVRVETVKNFLTRKFGGEVLTAEAIAKLEQLSSEQLDDLLFEAASWNSPSQMESYFNSNRV
jgi:hypothetical protein